MAKTSGSRDFSDLLEAIQILAWRPINHVSSSYPSFNDDWAHDAHGTISTMSSGIAMVTGLTCLASLRTGRSRNRSWPSCLENLQKGKKGSSKGHRKVKKGSGKSNYKQIRQKMHVDRLNRGWRDQPYRGASKDRGQPQQAQVDDFLARTLQMWGVRTSCQGLPQEQGGCRVSLQWRQGFGRGLRDFLQWHGVRRPQCRQESRKRRFRLQAQARLASSPRPTGSAAPELATLELFRREAPDGD